MSKPLRSKADADQSEPEEGEEESGTAEYWRLLGVTSTHDSLWVKAEKPKRVRLSNYRRNDKPSLFIRQKSCRLSEAKVREIDKLYHSEGMSTTSIANRYGISVRTVSDAIKRIKWKHVENEYGSEIRSRRASAARALKSGNMKLSIDQIHEVRRLYKDGLACRRIANKFGVGRGAILDIINGKTWQGVRQLGEPTITRPPGLPRKLSDLDAACLRNLRARGKTWSFIGRAYGVSARAVQFVCNLETYAKVSGTYVVLPPEEFVAE